MRKEKLKNGEIIKKVLMGTAGAAVALGLVVVLVALPGFGLVLKSFADWYKDADRSRRYQARMTFEKLRRKRLVEIKETKKGTEMVLTESGRKRVLKYRIEDLSVPKPKKWDGKWRIIIFDVPEKYKEARHSLRQKFKEWNFYLLQKSVWVSPHDCRNEVDFLIEFWRISPHVRLIETATFDGDNFMKEHYGL